MTGIEFSDDYFLDNEIKWVPVEWLMKHATTSCDFGELHLPEMMRRKCSDTGFGHLVNSILEHGFLDDSAIGFYPENDGYGELTEGHHRFAAAILLCLDRVPISVYGKDSRNNARVNPQTNYTHGTIVGYDPLPIAVEI